MLDRNVTRRDGPALVAADHVSVVVLEVADAPRDAVISHGRRVLAVAPGGRRRHHFLLDAGRRRAAVVVAELGGRRQRRRARQRSRVVVVLTTIAAPRRVYRPQSICQTDPKPRLGFSSSEQSLLLNLKPVS